MTSRERILAALNHREPDRVPYDLAGTTATGVSRGAYVRLTQARGLLAETAPDEADPIQQIVTPAEENLVALKSDTRRIGARRIPDFERLRKKDGEAWVVEDQWGCTWRMTEGQDDFFSLTVSPLSRYGSLSEGLKQWPMPEWGAAAVTATERDIAPLAGALGEYCGIADRNCAGLTEISSRVRGAEYWLMDTVLDPGEVETLIDRILAYKLDYWHSLLNWIKSRGLESKIQVISECDDLGTQTSTLLAPAQLRSLVIPRFKKLWGLLRREMPGARMFFHSCGAIRPIIPDLVEAGMDILNPVQFTAAGMDLRALKKDFGKDITFWGGGVDTQGTLVTGTPDDVREEVKRILDIMAPGGGFVFAPVHNIQSDVPAENFWAMWETLMDYGRYR